MSVQVVVKINLLHSFFCLPGPVIAFTFSSGACEFEYVIFLTKPLCWISRLRAFVFEKKS